MTPTEQDKELEQALNRLSELNKLSGRGHGDLADTCYVCGISPSKLLPYITADRKRVALEARLDEMKLHRHEWALFGDRPPYKGESVSLPILLAYHDDRIAELKAQQEEV